MLRAHEFPSELPRTAGLTARAADGAELAVLATAKGAFVAFDLEGSETIRFERPEGWAGAKVKPASAGAETRIEGAVLEIRLTRPRPLLVECANGFLLQVVAGPVIGEPPVPGPGGRLLRFAGGKVHETGCLRLQDNDVVWIEPGAWVRGQMLASHAAKVTIGGRGVLENPPRQAGVPAYRSIILDHCKDVSISGIRMLSTHGWMITVGNCDRVSIDGISQESDGGGTDGIDVVGSRDVTIRNCFLINGDDNIAVKAMNLKTQANPCQVPPGEFDGDWTGEVRNLLVEDSTFYNDHGGSAMEIGYETRTERISGIVFRNIDVMAVHHFGSVFGIHTGDRALIEDVLWEDVRVEHHYDMLLDFRILHSRWNRDAERGQVRRVTLRNIRVFANEFNEGYTISVIGGWDATHTIEDVRFEGFHINGKVVRSPDEMPLYTNHASSIVFA